MNVIFYNRDFSGRLPLPKGLTLTVERYSNHQIGGPEKATIRAKPTADRFDMRKLLRCPVEIEGTDGKTKFWGYVNRVNIPNGEKQRVGIGLDELYNYVIVAYADGDTAAASDTASVTEYGQKEIRINDYNADATQAAQTQNLYLADHKYPHIEFEFSGGDEEVVIECYGWYNTLGWKYYTDTDSTNTSNTTQISNIVTGAGQFFAGSIIENAAGIDSNENRDGHSTALTYVNQLLNAGTSNVRPLLARVDKSRYLHVYERGAEPPSENVKYVMRSDGRLETNLGTLVPDEDCTVAVWARLKEFSDFPPFFIERAEYTWDKDGGKTVYTPAGAFEQIRLAKYIASVVSGESDGSGGTTGGYTAIPYFLDHSHPPAPRLHRKLAANTADFSSGTEWLTVATAPASDDSVTYGGLNYLSPGTDSLGRPGWQCLVGGIYAFSASLAIYGGTGGVTSGIVSAAINKRDSLYSTVAKATCGVPVGGIASGTLVFANLYGEIQLDAGDYVSLAAYNNTDGNLYVAASTFMIGSLIRKL